MVCLDFEKFVNCHFINCEIRVNGYPFSLEGCKFKECSLSLGGIAANIANLMYVFFPKKIPLIFKLEIDNPLKREKL